MKLKKNRIDPNNFFYKKLLETGRRSILMLEISYNGNVGFEEVAKFYEIASPDEIKELERLININDLESAWNLIENVIGTKLVR